MHYINNTSPINLEAVFQLFSEFILLRYVFLNTGKGRIRRINTKTHPMCLKDGKLRILLLLWLIWRGNLIEGNTNVQRKPMFLRITNTF